MNPQICPTPVRFPYGDDRHVATIRDNRPAVVLRVCCGCGCRLTIPPDGVDPRLWYEDLFVIEEEPF